MHCPFCGHEETKVTDSRLAGEGQQIRRRRECLKCAERFTTFETAELLMPHLIKSDATREPFDEKKLRSGMIKALEKRPVSAEAVDAAVAHDYPDMLRIRRRNHALLESRGVVVCIIQRLLHDAIKTNAQRHGTGRQAVDVA